MRVCAVKTSSPLKINQNKSLLYQQQNRIGRRRRCCWEDDTGQRSSIVCNLNGLKRANKESIFNI